MIIYHDCLSNAELVSDAFKLTEVDGCVYEVEGKWITVADGVAGDASDGNAETGADAGSAVAADAGARVQTWVAGADAGADVDDDADTVADTNSVSAIDVVHMFKLQETFYDRSTYRLYFKGYMRRVRAFLEANRPDEVDQFVKRAPLFAKSVLANISDCQFSLARTSTPRP
ncbi:translationally-controlled tumor protein [Thecamonas trahens ATCC 50062]|uniref:Translationally-controlled tumor protein n=1 Tax=Thecamonas trahens ATCC 50062 TaxID=461836 RepID=A0A0L0DDW0_THETB|nr:translationally-controlled tumor protein [Thecamonas trahens ATCC 50062]KNC49503.1 translationally-controlled tumor protein [Thecamonas trahens ATCC 50062]|eukprot:XP_013757620.1 translationally-controlled tumor protein [Thecamonas trahens ATCC 50062]